MSRNGMRPVHPGEILRDELEALEMSAKAFAAALDVPGNRITAILNGQRGVTADTALRLSRYLGTTAEFWLNLQKTFELRTAEIKNWRNGLRTTHQAATGRLNVIQPEDKHGRAVLQVQAGTLHRFLCREFAHEDLRHHVGAAAGRCQKRDP